MNKSVFSLIVRFLAVVLFLFLVNCSKSNDSNNDNSDFEVITDDDPEPTQNFADIDFSNWKITLPVDENNNGSPDEYQPNQLANFVYQDVSLDKWPYENYFKAGNYLNTTDVGAYSYVKYYDLSITH